MKTKITLFLVFLFCCIILQAQLTFVPDDNFEQALIDLHYDDVLDDYVITSNIAGITTLDVSDPTVNPNLPNVNGKIADLTGIEDFFSLTELLCSDNQLTSLDVSQNIALRNLRCDNNQLTSLDVSQNPALTRLNCSYNQLTRLDVTHNLSLMFLQCHDNQLLRLDVTQNYYLATLYCDNNQLTSLDVRNGSNGFLLDFNAQNNPSLLCINVDNEASANADEFPYSNWEKDATATYSETCSYTDYTYVPDDNFELALIDLGYDDVLDDYVITSNITGVTSLDVSDPPDNPNLPNVNGKITDLTGIEDFFSLTELLCSDNQLTSLDVSQNPALTILNCSYNQLTSLDVRNGSNGSLLDFNAQNNPSLLCINVDNEASANADEFPYSNWEKDATATYSETCSNIPLTYVPDDNFEQALIDLHYDDVLDDYVHISNIAGITTLDVSDPTVNPNLPNVNGKIADLTGIEDFFSLTELLCSDNQLTSLDVSQNIALRNLRCDNNQLTSLDVSQNPALTRLNCSYNQLTRLDVTHNLSLMFLQCHDNQLLRLDVTQNYYLATLYCDNNQLTSLDVRNGSNGFLLDFNAQNNPSLLCINVDNEASANADEFPYSNWEKDATATYSETCSYTDYTYVPDDNFELALIDLGYDDVLDDYVITSNITGVTSLDVSDPPDNPNLPNVNGKITDLTGIEDFIDLEQLICSKNQLTSIDISQNSQLIDLRVDNNHLTELDVSQNKELDILWCFFNQLTTLDIRANTKLRFLSTHNNSITSLDVSNNPLLITLSCSTNPISSLDVSKNPNLKFLVCFNSLLSNLDVTYNTKLGSLLCFSNQISNLDLSNNLELYELYCYSNELTELDLTNNPFLVGLRCQDNLLTELDVRNGNNTILDVLVASNNDLTCINVDNEVAQHPDWEYDSYTILSNECSNNTQRGEDVSVPPIDATTGTTPVEVVYQNVTLSGNTTLETRNSGPDVPNGFVLGDPPVYYDLTTTANHTGIIQIIIEYDESVFEDETGLRLLHYETDQWIDVTVYVDTETNRIYGEVYTLSPFLIGQDIASPVLSGVPLDATVECDAVPQAPIVTALDNIDGTVDVEFVETVLPVGECANEQTITRQWTAVDGAGNTTTATQTIIVVDTEAPIPPISPNDITVLCTSDIPQSINLTAIDNCDGEVTVFPTEKIIPGSHGKNYTIIRTWTFADECGNVSSVDQTIWVDDITPSISSITLPLDPVPLNTLIEVVATSPDNNLESVTWDWGDGTIPEEIFGAEIHGEHTYLEAGVYTITLTLTDLCGESVSSEYQYIVVYDPSAGFVTGGGWIDSPAGASTLYPEAVGKANFGFVSKYKKGATIPTGNTEFQFKAGDLKFNSYVYDWLVIAGSKAKFKGEGTVNGSGQYGFMISAIDGDLKDKGDPDLFRIKIWDKAYDVVVYDNQMGENEDADPATTIGGGSIVIHTKDKTKGASIIDPEAKINIYPNPFDNSIYIDLCSENTHEIIIDMVDMNGRIIEHMFTGILTAEVEHQFELNTKPDLIPGSYVLRIRTENGGLLAREMILKQ